MGVEVKSKLSRWHIMVPAFLSRVLAAIGLINESFTAILFAIMALFVFAAYSVEYSKQDDNQWLSFVLLIIFGTPIMAIWHGVFLLGYKDTRAKYLSSIN